MQKLVASIFFTELRVERPLYGGNFVLPAVARGQAPYLLPVNDHIQIERMPFIAGGGIVPRVIAGEHIAADIVMHVSELGMGMSTDTGPGVWAVRDRVPLVNEEDGSWQLHADGKPVTREASDSERNQMFAEDLANATARQERYGQYLIAEGDRYNENVKERILITTRMKAACVYYHRERPWLIDLRDGDMKLCPFCMASIDARAIKCPKCSEIVDAARFASLTADRKQVAKELAAKKTTARLKAAAFN